MAKLSVRNDTDDMLGLWVEPWGTDHWMHPGEAFTIAIEAKPEEAPFDVVVHGQGVSVGVNAAGDADVLDAEGQAVPCGHQRPTSR